jgi:hypothetical protein
MLQRDTAAIALLPSDNVCRGDRMDRSLELDRDVRPRRCPAGASSVAEEDTGACELLKQAAARLEKGMRRSVLLNFLSYRA